MLTSYCSSLIPANMCRQCLTDISIMAISSVLTPRAVKHHPASPGSHGSSFRANLPQYPKTGADTLHDSRCLAQRLPNNAPPMAGLISCNNISPISRRSGETRLDVATPKVGDMLDDRGLRRPYVIDSRVCKMGTRMKRVVLGVARVTKVAARE